MNPTKEEIKDEQIKQDVLEDEMLKMEEKKEDDQIDFLKYYVEPHKKISRIVEESDLERLLEDAHIMYNLCFTQSGKYGGAKAIAHSQIDDNDPLRFFVTADKKIVINPEVLRHTNNTVDSIEGCLSFPDLPMIIVQRWNKLEVKYLTIEGEGEKMVERVENLSSEESRVFQHELQHLDGKNIYNL